MKLLVVATAATTALAHKLNSAIPWWIAGTVWLSLWLLVR